MSGLPTAGRVGAVWLDGDLVPPAEAVLPVLSFGLHNAACVFEGLRVYGGRAFALAAHTQRFIASGDLIGMPLPYSAARIDAAVQAAVREAGFAEAYVRPVAWRGDEAIGISPRGTTVHVAVAVLRWPDPAATPRPAPRLALSRWRRPAPDMMPVQAKASANYVTGALALGEANAAGFDDAVLLDHRGGVAEATGANIFAVHDGRLRTPPADTCLDGITRRVVLRLAAAQGVPTEVRPLGVDELSAADEVFLTGTASEVQPVAGFGDAAYATDGPVTGALADAYARLVRSGVAAGPV